MNSALLDLFLPRKCIVCGSILSVHERHVCTSCLADLPRTFFSRQRRNQMADRFNGLIAAHMDQESFKGYAYATALFFYRSGTGYRDITRRLKYHSDLAAGRFFAGMLAKEIASSPLYSDVDLVIPVPLHWTRRWARGYNQAAVIGRVLAAGLGTELREDILFRRRRTRTQTKLSLEGKAANVAGAFGVRRRSGVEKYSHILLVDDVFTTGATMLACYRALRAVLPVSARISVATLACVGY
ncbi:MAG: ComF family protein [Bacteroidales bacterium]|nr:ComF family protein [Bacteroidales bacterium]